MGGIFWFFNLNMWQIVYLMPDLPALSDLEPRDLEHNTATLHIKTINILTLQWFRGSTRHRFITPSPWTTTHLPGLNAHG